MSNVELPEFLKPYRKTAEKWIHDGLIEDIEFSDVTYQIAVKDPRKQKKVWTFLQFGESGKLKDSFCGCDEDSEEIVEGGSKGCPHLAAAYLRIFEPDNIPLHSKFKHSFWNQICRLCADRLGLDSDVLKPAGEGTYEHESFSGKKIMVLRSHNGKGKSLFDTLIFDRPLQTEETSIKFSNLTTDEIQLWKSGNPPPELGYELSFWSDLAKWMFLQQVSGNHYSVELKPIDQVPNQIKLSFEPFECEFYLSQNNLAVIVPSLTTIDTQLKIVDTRIQGITSIAYNKEKHALHLESSQITPVEKDAIPANSIPIGNGWSFAPKVGFFASDPQHTHESSIIKGKAVGQFLSQNTSLAKTLFKDAHIYEDPVRLSYKIQFNKQWDLTIQSYLFQAGDLQEHGSAIFGDWVYLNDDGFYKLEETKFDKAQFTVNVTEVADFVLQNRHWFNMQKGFQLHVGSLEEQLTYSIDTAGRLTFERLDQHKTHHYSHDFGQFLYVTGMGFYPKHVGITSKPVRSGVTIGKDQVPLFIRAQRDELQFVNQFFSETNPVEKAGFDFKVLTDGTLSIEPRYEIKKKYKDSRVIFYDDFVYTENEGFYEMPFSQRLPEPFRHGIELKGHALEEWITTQMDELLQRAFYVDKRLQKPQQLTLYAEGLSKNDLKEDNTFLATFQFVTELGKVTAYHVWNAIQAKRKFLLTDAGLLSLHEDRFNWLRGIRKGRFSKDGKLSLTTLELIRLNAFDEIHAEQTLDPQNPRHVLESVTQFTQTPPPVQKFLASRLRKYQELGLHWLWFLYKNSLSGLLCDDMGLGKTHQAMGLIDAIMQDNPNAACLVICPTSVLFHWQEKLHKYLPKIPVYTFYGSQRSLTHFKQHKGILLTSYGIARNEAEELSKISFDLAVMDEIQMAKNHNSRVHNALLTIQARMRLGMTGTPLENYLRELKSLFDLTLPSYLPSDRDFREFFIKPVEKEHSFPRKLLLTRLIKPFILRRKKEDVLTELPPKIEELAHCSLLHNQRIMYNEVLNQNRSGISALENGREPIPYVHIFSILGSLKQICNHPASFLKKPQDYKEYHSGKWNLFVELLNEARHSGQKIVVFTHYLAMLDIMELYLNEHGIEFASIRGSTTNRGEQVSRFQNDPHCEVFLGSLQAAGTGIDLTAASVVIHYDRWWNAAKEDQATDRVHRIGQSRGVQVFKLVTKDSFEERIDKLIESKAQLMEDIVTVDDHQILKKLDRDELLNLLKTVDVNKGLPSINLDDEE